LGCKPIISKAVSHTIMTNSSVNNGMLAEPRRLGAVAIEKNRAQPSKMARPAVVTNCVLVYWIDCSVQAPLVRTKFAVREVVSWLPGLWAIATKGSGTPVRSTPSL